MSRIGRLPVPVPSGVDVTVEEQLVTVKGPKGTLTHTIANPIALERAETELRRLEDEALTNLTADERGQLRKLLAKALEEGD